jgi:hypothetical protein
VLGRIWYVTLPGRLAPDADFNDFARATADIAGELYGNGGRVQRIVADAWSSVGLAARLFDVTTRITIKREAAPRAAMVRKLSKWRRHPAR